MKQILRYSLMLVFALVSYTSYAQVTTGTLSGLVSDGTEPLIGATVTATHEPTGTVYGITTREDGRYTLPNLRVGGPYTVAATYIGHQSQKVGNINLTIAQKLKIDFRLQPTSTELEEIVVLGKENDVMNNERTGAATTINSKMLKSLPTISRSASDYYRLSPSSDGNSFGGRNDQYNNFSLDGTIFNNPFGLDAATPGGQTDAQPISLDAIEQIQVSLAPYDVTQAGFTGAAINAVTKSGTNEFKGTVYGFFRNESLTGSKVSGNDVYVSDLAQFQTGFSVGGPIIKNKLFFFVNFEAERRSDAGSNFLAAASGVTGENVSRVTAADLDMVSDALMTRFGYETGPYQNYLLETNNQKGIVKLDWNISKNTTLTATYNFLDAYKEKPAHPSAIGRRGPDLTTLQFKNSGYRMNNVIHSGLVEVKSIFGNKASNKLQIGRTSFRDDRSSFSTPFPVININKDGIRYIVAGHEPFSINNVLSQDVMQLTDNFNIYAGSHTITLGTSLERFNFDNSFNLGVYDAASNIGGTFGPGWNSAQEFVDSVNAGNFDDEVAFARATGDAANWALAETNVGQFAIYAQDEWTPTQDLTLTVGIRMDMPLYFDTKEKIQENIDRNCCYDPTITYYDENGDAVQFDHTVLPKQTPLISPRLGFNYDIKGDNTMQLRGGTGLFSGRLPFVWIGNQVANPNWWFYNVTSPNFKFPQVWRTNIGYDHDFGDNLILSADFIYTKDMNAMMVRNYGLNAPSGTLNGVDNRPVYVDSTDRALVFGTVPTNAYVFSNTNVGSSTNITFELKKTFANGLYANLGYNFLNAFDASSIEAEISSDAYERNPAYGNVNTAIATASLYGNRHRIVGAAYKTFEWSESQATSIALFFEAAQGGRFSYTYSGNINNDGSGLNDLIYIPTDSEIDQMTFDETFATEAAQQTAMKAFFAQDEYASENRGQYAEKYAILSPWYSKVDVRILHDISFKAGAKPNTVQLSVDILNFGNLLNSNWGVRQLPVNTQPIGVTVNGNDPTYTFDTNLTSTFTDDFSLASRWQMQFGIRYIF